MDHRTSGLADLNRYTANDEALTLMDEWEVDLAVSGPIKVPRASLRIQTLKGDYLPFETNVTLKNEKNGVHLSVGVRAQTSSDANDAAVYFVGRAVDVLCLKTDLPLHVSTSGPQFRQSNIHAKRVVDNQLWSTCFENGRQYGAERSTFCRALSWFRKGHTSEDPVDKFLAFWAAIEVVGSKFARDTERTRNGAINKICDCFDQLWGGVADWKVIPNSASRLNQFCKKRNNIVHGTVPLVELTSIRDVADDIPVLHELAREFLRDWQTSAATQEMQAE